MANSASHIDDPFPSEMRKLLSTAGVPAMLAVC